MSAEPVRTAVVTGGHRFDVPGFHRLFRGLEGIDAYIQHLDDFASAPEEVRDAYDTVVFYTLFSGTPGDEGLPWHAGHPRSALEHLGATPQGIFVLHHAILSFLGWDVWYGITGIGENLTSYHVNQALDVHVAHPGHPITAGLAAWTMTDETYVMNDPGAGSTPLLATDHPNSMRTLAWTRQYCNSRVFCFQSGHDNQTWANPSFREVIARGIRWCARRM
jgi:hypothetical protein